LRADTLQELLAREWRYELREDPQLNRPTAESDTHATADEGRAACFLSARVTSAA
jgi:hypothetical protein